SGGEGEGDLDGGFAGGAVEGDGAPEGGGGEGEDGAVGGAGGDDQAAAARGRRDLRAVGGGVVGLDQAEAAPAGVADLHDHHGALVRHQLEGGHDRRGHPAHGLASPVDHQAIVEGLVV